MTGPTASERPASFALALLLTGLALYPAASNAQVVRGSVLDAAAQTPIAGATIELREASHTRDPIRATSDSAGGFVLTAPHGGTYMIQARKIGFLTAPPDTIRIARDEAIQVEMRLDANAIPLEPVRVTARGDSTVSDVVHRTATGFGRTISRSEIDARGAQATTDLFRVMPGFVVRSLRRGATAELLMRGTLGLCQPAVWIDGSYVPMTRTTIDAVVSPLMIDHVEIYNTVAAAPTPYRIGTCGVLLFTTRHGEVVEGSRVSWKRLAIGAGVGLLLVFLAVR